MQGRYALLACPACRTAFADSLWCAGCGTLYSSEKGIARLRLSGNARTEKVRQFYDEAPFPGYPPNDSLERLRARAERSGFARLLDASIPGDATIAEIGCGTGQMSLYLARADRSVVGADMSAAALGLAAAAAERYRSNNVQFVETDIFRPGLGRSAFDVVYCSGVLHHTPDPQTAFGRIVQLAKPGAMIVLGLYNRFARAPLRLRRLVARATGYRWIPLDPVLRDRASEPERREAWLRDQYMHPEEHRHSVREVRRWFDNNDVEFVRTYPSTIAGDEPNDLFTPAEDEWAVETWLAQLGWMNSLGHEGGLFITVGRRREACN